MQADRNDINRLLQLQKIDMDLLRSKKKLGELPQREKILNLRKKKEEILGKQEQIVQMRKNVERDRARVDDEDERLITRQGETQKKIDEAQGDYRAIESLSRDLNGISKRRVSLEADRAVFSEKLSQIEEVETQIEGALSTIEKQEREAVESFQKEGGTLTNTIAQLKVLRETTKENLAGGLYDTYEKKKQKSGGVGVAVLQNGACSVCRTQIDQGKLLQLKAEAPLGECPSCKRMIVVSDE